MKDVVRISSAVPKLKLADVKFNCEQIIAQAKRAYEEKSSIVLFPELALTGYTCGDLFFQDSLLYAVKDAISYIAKSLSDYDITLVFGAPLMLRGGLYNCAVTVCKGKIYGISVKTFMPNYNEFSEKRWFSSSKDLTFDNVNASELGLDSDYSFPIGRDLVFEYKNSVSFGVEICEDLWTPVPPSSFLALGGAQIILNPSASNETVYKREYRRKLVCDQASKCFAAYAYTSSGTDESTTDLVFSGHSVFSLNGEILAENEKILDNDYILSVDIDLGKIKSERVRTTVFKDSVSLYGKHQTVRYVSIDADVKESDAKLLHVSASPFIPESKDERAGYLGAIFDMQTEALKRRLELTGALPVVGVSGGLDSTLALLVAVNAVKRIGKSASAVHGITMPCFGTSGRTYNNSVELMKKLGVTYREISIKDAVLSHFKDMGHDPEVLDLTYENAQARERTQVLMDYAGKVGGLVVGTGDLSELALGWCTYNADHMSMYGVNAGVPKTVVRGVIEWLIESHGFEGVNSLLADVLDTPISPELLPPDKSGDISQVTQDLVGPYELHDFYIYYVIRYGFEPKKIFDLANVAFGDKYDRETLKKWLKSFYKRFFTQQFKRSCQPDGVKVERISLSPRGDFRMPSDASARLWLDEVEKL